MDSHPIADAGIERSQGIAPQVEAAMRRTIDLVLGSIALLILSPLILAIAAIVRLDSSGPALFRQRRVGKDQSEFTVFKFRSMYTGAETKSHQDYVTALIREGDKVEGPEDGGLYKLEGDARITRSGRWIRALSLDELPQLLNVIGGQMSLVGPRPAIAYEVEQYPSWYLRRFAVKPGMTGLWQVSGRNERTYEEMVRLDVDYVEQQSLWLDISILVRTPLTVLGGRGAS